MQLRDYQRQAIDALYAYLQANDDNPVIVAPTGSGKSLIIAQIVVDVTSEGGRAIALAHVKELLEQNANKILAFKEDIDLGIYSAGLKSRNTTAQVIVAGIQSVRNRACELGRFDIIIIDEAHRLSPDENTSYQKFIADAKIVNPNVRVIGLTATPYRLDCGSLCGPENLFNAVAHEIGINELIEAGFLCRLYSKSAKHEVQTAGLHVRAGEFVADEVEQLVDTDIAVRDAVAEIVMKSEARKSVLIFAASVKHGEHIVAEFRQAHGFECGYIIGDTADLERSRTLERFESGELKYLCNVGVLTTGYDCPKIDLIAVCRPTLSPGLFVQMVGRGLRIHPDKTDCLILDFGQNFRRHGPVDAIRVKEKDDVEGDAPCKECPECGEMCHASVLKCPACGHEFPPIVKKQTYNASKAAALSSQQKITFTDCEVIDTRYSEHHKKGADESHPKTLRVEYKTGKLGMWRSEWVCFEHDGFAREKAVKWWKMRSPDPCPRTIKRVLEIIDSGGIAITTGIRLKEKENDKFPEIVSYTVGPMPEPVPLEDYELVLELANQTRECLPAGLGYESAPPELAAIGKEEDIPW